MGREAAETFNLVAMAVKRLMSFSCLLEAFSSNPVRPQGKACISIALPDREQRVPLLVGIHIPAQ